MVDPPKHAAGQVADLRKPLGTQEILGFGAAHPRLALGHDVGVGVELDVPLRQVAERYQDRAGKTVDLELLRFADVDNNNLIAAVDIRPR